MADSLTREQFMQGQRPYFPAPGKTACAKCSFQLEHCGDTEWDGYLCRECGARFTQRCTFDEECA